MTTLEIDLSVRPDGPAADSRDMVAVHDMFRRQFRALLDLLAAAPVDRPDDVRLLTDHADFLVTVLHAHHGGEDAIAWPRIEARGGAEARALAGAMESQQEQIDAALERLSASVAVLAVAPSRITVDAASAAARAALTPIEDHLAVEEAQVLTLIDRHLTQAEWASVAGHGMDELPQAMFPVMYGMLLEDMTPEMYDVFSAPIPDEVIGPMALAGPPAYAEHVARLRAAIDPA